MISPRITAGIVVLLLISVFSLSGIVLTMWAGPLLTHDPTTLHVGGKITNMVNVPAKNFVFETDDHQTLNFRCGDGCRASLTHMQRHVNEQAHTDVYYRQGPDNTLQALYVD
ncbi:MAG: hypothetical protein E6J34_16190 [Chloroflexi bacterium]|nr:MAG: hypothetical protein E6J34_16190 [Chloroflexota bacterium]